MRLDQIFIQDRLFSLSFGRILEQQATGNTVASLLCQLAQDPKSKEYTRNITLVKSEPGMASFLPKGKDCILTPEDHWSRENRQQAKIGKVLRKIIAENAPTFVIVDKDIEALVNQLKASIADGNFKLVEGADIAYWYNRRQYEQNENTGTLAGSCMRGADPDFFQIYGQNSDVVKLLILTNDNGNLIGRALVWHTEVGTFVDRIYGSDTTIERFKSYASERGWYYKLEQNYYNKTDWVNPEGNRERIELSVSINFTGCSRMPYIDTFTFFSQEYSTLSNFYSDNNEFACESTGGYLRKNGYDYVYESYKEFKWMRDDKCRYMNNGIFAAYKHLRSTIDGDYIYKDDAVQLYDGNYCSKESRYLMQDADGHYFHTRHHKFYICQFDHRTYLEAKTDKVTVRKTDGSLITYNAKNVLLVDMTKANKIKQTILNFETNE